VGLLDAQECDEAASFFLFLCLYLAFPFTGFVTFMVAWMPVTVSIAGWQLVSGISHTN
jgi:hypothetical protein